MSACTRPIPVKAPGKMVPMNAVTMTTLAKNSSPGRLCQKVVFPIIANAAERAISQTLPTSVAIVGVSCLMACREGNAGPRL